jgi:hypothetical protein
VRHSFNIPKHGWAFQRKEIKINLTKTDNDRDSKAVLFYELNWPDLTKCKRPDKYDSGGVYFVFDCVPLNGDVICSLRSTFGARNDERSEKFIPYAIRSDGSKDENRTKYLELFNNDDIHLFYKFKEYYRCLGNYCLTPGKLNKWRGGFENNCDGINQWDYFDIYLDLLRKYYYGVNIYESQDKILDCEPWLRYFGVGKDGYKKLINDNAFDSFVNNNREVKDIFAPHELFISASAPLVGSYHKYGQALPSETNKSCSVQKQYAVNFMKNSLWAWQQRESKLKVTNPIHQ